MFFLNICLNVAIGKVKIKNKKAKIVLSSAFCLFCFTFFSSCGGQNNAQKKGQQDKVATSLDTSLVFNDVTLDQADAQGRPVWKVKAKQANYSSDKKTAVINNPTGDLFQDGKLVMQVTAASGEVQQDGQQVFLKGQVTATDPRNGAVLKGDELEWFPKKDLLIVRNNVRGSHPQLQTVAKEGRYFSRAQQLELLGGIVAATNDPALLQKATGKAQEGGSPQASPSPSASPIPPGEVVTLQMRTEHLVWQIPQKMAIADRRIQIDRYKGKAMTAQVVADKSEVNLETRTAVLKQNVDLTSLDPPIQIASNLVVWNLNTEIVVSDQPVKLVHRVQNVTVTGNRSQVDLQRKVAFVTGGVQGVVAKNQSKIYANQLTWEMPNQVAQAEGNAIYQQVQPPVQMFGNKVNWNYNNQMVISEQPVRIVDLKEQVTVTGDRAQLDVQKQIAVVNGNAQGSATRNQAKLFANQLRWNIATQQVQADGNVNYRQVDPPLNLKGPAAFGKLQDQTVVVTGNTGDRVVTEIIPSPLPNRR